MAATTKKPTLKAFPVQVTVEGAVELALDTLRELQEECQEQVDNASGTNFENSPLIEALGTATDTLDSIVSDLESAEFPEVLATVEVSFTENRRKGISRSDRRDNASNALSAAYDALNEWLDDNEDHDDADEIGLLRDTIEAQRDDLDSVEFTA